MVRQHQTLRHPQSILPYLPKPISIKGSVVKTHIIEGLVYALGHRRGQQICQPLIIGLQPKVLGLDLPDRFLHPLNLFVQAHPILLVPLPKPVHSRRELPLFLRDDVLEVFDVGLVLLDEFVFSQGLLFEVLVGFLDLFIAVLDLDEGYLQVGQLLPQVLDAVLLIADYTQFQIFTLGGVSQGLFALELNLVYFLSDFFEIVMEFLMCFFPGGLFDLTNDQPATHVPPPRFNELPLGKILPDVGRSQYLLLFIDPSLPVVHFGIPLLDQLLLLLPNLIDHLSLQPDDLLLLPFQPLTQVIGQAGWLQLIELAFQNIAIGCQGFELAFQMLFSLEVFRQDCGQSADLALV